MPDILILSAGRRVSLVRLFQKAASDYGLVVGTADMQPQMSSACRDCGIWIKLPHVGAFDYAMQLEDYCRSTGVKLIIPTIDTELHVLARLKAHFASFGCTIVVSEIDIVEHCADKRITENLVARYGLKVPRAMQPDALTYPLIIKPYDGSLSVGITVARSPRDITPAHLENPRNMFCDYLEHSEYEEFTCDAYFDRGHRIRSVVPRFRIEVRGGEVSKGRAVRNDIVPFLMEGLKTMPGAVGCLTIQLMRHKNNGEIYLIEINPRFGGGYPLTAATGAVYHRWLIEEYILNRNVETYVDWEDGLTMLRYDAEVFVRD